MTAAAPHTLAVDIGGSHVKTIVLDPLGKASSERSAMATPRPATPVAIIDVIAQLAAKQQAYDRVAVGFPGVVQRGITKTAPNLDPSWRGFEFERELTARLGHPCRIANDADVQGFGAIAGTGVELVLTLGTGLGSALFIDGILVPNLELAHHPFEENLTYEQRVGQAALEAVGVDEWKARLHRAVDLLRATFNFDVLYLGGGNSRILAPDEFPADIKLVQNVAGLLGGIALWTDVHGTSLVRSPQAEGAHCVITATVGESGNG